MCVFVCMRVCVLPCVCVCVCLCTFECVCVLLCVQIFVVCVGSNDYGGVRGVVQQLLWSTKSRFVTI